MRRTDCLDLLGLDEAATADEIKIAYWRLAKELHPDTGAGREAHDDFISLSRAYRQLRAVARRTMPVPVPEPVPVPDPVPVSQRPVRAAETPAARSAPRRRVGGRRWLAIATFSLTAAGILFAADATLRALDTASPGSGSRVGKTVTTPPVPVAAPGIPAAQSTSAATAIPPILAGRSVKEGSRNSTSPKPLTKTEPPRRTEPLRQVSRAETSPVLRMVPKRLIAPMAPKPIVPRAMAPIVRRQTIQAASLPLHRAPVMSRAGHPGRWTGATVRDRIRQMRNEPTGRGKIPVASPPRVRPTAPRTSFEALTKPSLDLLRSALGVR